MANDYFNTSGTPGTGTFAQSTSIRSEFAAIQAAFDKMVGLTGNAGKVPVINPTATAVVPSIISQSGSAISVAGTIAATTVLDQADNTTNLVSSSWVTLKLADYAPSLYSSRDISAGSYTIVPSDHGTKLRFTNPSGCVVTIPNSILIPIGFVCELYCDSDSGIMDITSANTINVPFGADLSAEDQGSSISIHKVANTVWDAVGQFFYPG